MRSCHPPAIPLSRFQSHLKSKAKFLLWRDPIPRPSEDLLLITLCQATLQMPWEFEVPLHRKEQMIEEMALVMPFGIEKTDMKYIGKELKTYLIRHMLSAMLRNLPLHMLSFALIVDNIGFQVKSLLGLAPRGSPRYLIGKVSLQ